MITHYCIRHAITFNRVFHRVAVTKLSLCAGPHSSGHQEMSAATTETMDFAEFAFTTLSFKVSQSLSLETDAHITHTTLCTYQFYVHYNIKIYLYSTKSDYCFSAINRRFPIGKNSGLLAKTQNCPFLMYAYVFFVIFFIFV